VTASLLDEQEAVAVEGPAARQQRVLDRVSHRESFSTEATARAIIDSSSVGTM
jgi:hypothetical protein